MIPFEFNFPLVTLDAEGSVVFALMQKPSDEVRFAKCDRTTATVLLKNLSSTLAVGRNW